MSTEDRSNDEKERPAIAAGGQSSANPVPAKADERITIRRLLVRALMVGGFGASAVMAWVSDGALIRWLSVLNAISWFGVLILELLTWRSRKP